jgi:glutathionyl-hydroquinone reductase
VEERRKISANNQNRQFAILKSSTQVPKKLILSKNCRGQYAQRKFLAKFSEFYGVLSQLPLAYPKWELPQGGFAAHPGRYHLYVSFACPWAHRLGV